MTKEEKVNQIIEMINNSKNEKSDYFDGGSDEPAEILIQRTVEALYGDDKELMELVYDKLMNSYETLERL